MVVGKLVELPPMRDLKSKEINLTTLSLMAVAPYIGKYCEGINNEFMLCRQENNDPRPCLGLGKFVTACTLELLTKVKKTCLHEFKEYSNCLFLSTSKFEPWHCRKTQQALDECMVHKLCVEKVHFGYFTRGRIHKSRCMEPPEPKDCPCLPKVEDATPSLPDCKVRVPARFTSRLFWMTE